MQASLKIVWSILFSLSFLYIKGADTLFVDHSSGDYNLTSNYLSIFRDSSRTFEIEDLIREDKAHWFRPPESTNPHAFDPQANYWVRFTVKGKVLTQKGWKLEAAE